MYLCNHRLVFEATYQFICLCVVTVVGFEHQEVRGVVVRAEGHHGSWRDVEGLSVQIWTVFDDSQHKGVICHHHLNIVRLVGDSVAVSDGEIDAPDSLIPHEPNWHNICVTTDVVRV